MSSLIPTAYEIMGLTAATIVAVAVTNSLYPIRTQLIAGRYAAEVGRADMLSAAAPLVVALSAPVLLAFAKPVGVIAQGLVRWIGYRRHWRTLYGGSPRSSPGLVPAEGPSD
jgi:hypothetical protein